MNARSLRRQLRGMVAYIVVVYVPFVVALMLSGQSVWRLSLSRIAWQHGGLQWMVLFGVLTLPFMAYLVFFYWRVGQRSRAKNALVTVLLVGGAALFIGMLLPERTNDLVGRVHFYLEDISTVVVMLAVTGMVARFCVASGPGQRRARRVLFGAGYGLFAVAALAVFLFRGTSAMYEMALSLAAMVTLTLLNHWQIQS